VMSVIVDVIVNRRSQRKYEEFQSSLAQAWIVLEEIRRVLGTLNPAALPSGYRYWSHEELLALQSRAEKSLDTLEKKAHRYKADLISREWRL
jgi:hypothetical protein